MVSLHNLSTRESQQVSFDHPVSCSVHFILRDPYQEFHMCISGYQLCDNSVGVLFNDYTRLIMYADGDSLQYIDKTAAESYLNVRSYPHALNKKVSSRRSIYFMGFRLNFMGIITSSTYCFIDIMA